MTKFEPADMRIFPIWAAARRVNGQWEATVQIPSFFVVAVSQDHALRIGREILGADREPERFAHVWTGEPIPDPVQA